MKSAFRKSFTRDVKKIKNRDVLERVRQAIEKVEKAAGLSEIANLKKIVGTADWYRIRVGEYRIGVVIQSDTAEFVRCLPRRDLYRYFP